MIRIIGAALVFTAFSVLGVSISSGMKAKEKRLYLCIKMTEDISDMIRWNALTVSDIARQLHMGKCYEKLGFTGILSNELEIGISFPSAWNKAISETDILDKDEKMKLYELGGVLGSRDVEGQLSSIGLIRGELQRMYDEQREKYRTKGKLYRTIGVTVGAMAGIMLV